MKNKAALTVGQLFFPHTEILFHDIINEKTIISKEDYKNVQACGKMFLLR